MAHHLHQGLGYRFNPRGPIVDAVTPLGWAYLLAPFAARPWMAWTAARWLGVVAWVATAGWLGKEIQREGGKPWPTLLFVGLAPLGAWASAGMETGVVIALVTLSTTRKGWGLVPVAIAAAMRPELVPFAFVLACGRSTSPRRTAVPLALALGPAAFVALLRVAVFGVPYPLSAMAKPAELSSGVFYVAQTLLLGGPFWLWLGPGFRRLPRADRAVALAIFAHLVTVALAGGDWMVLLRLTVPVFPAALRVAAALAIARGPRWQIPTWVCAVAATTYLGVKAGLPGRHIEAQRAALVGAAEPVLANAKVVAALDVGWLGLAFPGSVVDFAGVTDPHVARLAGGHTTKRVELGLLRARDVDHVVLLLAAGAKLERPWESSQFARGVEYRVAALAADLGCGSPRLLPLVGTTQSYVVLHCKGTR